ncbi:MAG: hypothetical protein CL844_05915 [Crocinitomicaceae bacterium]|nr:hypothetical protein [Crocinitomicaceae bacterium]|tara:strand:+ start:50095 stop:51876 length:1782 start_codon:yes stop_codon:yes gene_type:complete
MRNIFILILIISIPLFSFCQHENAEIVKKNELFYYKHKVVSGNTFYSIQKQYDVSSNLILNENLSSIDDSLKIGQFVMIPVITIDYIVQEKETIYGLSRKFRISQNQLIELNPKILEGLKKGAKIQVPKNIFFENANTSDKELETPNPFVTNRINEDSVDNYIRNQFSDSTIQHTVMSHETLYSISKRYMMPIKDLIDVNNLSTSVLSEGQVLIINVKSENLEKVDFGVINEQPFVKNDTLFVFDVKDEYNIAILLPFQLDSTSNYSKYLSTLSAHFYMGARMALDSLDSQGLNAKVYFFDTNKDSTSVVNILKDDIFSSMDLVIGPFNPNNIELVSKYCKENNIRMVLPILSDQSLLKDNEFVYASVASNNTLMKQLALYMLNNYGDDNIILIKPNDVNSLPLYEDFRKTFLSSDSLEENHYNLIETKIDGFNTYIKRGVKTRFILPTLDRGDAKDFMVNLNRSAFRSKTSDLFVYGTKEWLEFTEINDVYKNKYNFHFVSSNMDNYYSNLAINLNKSFRSIYKTDMSRLAMQAYDVVLYYCSYFFLDRKQQELLRNDFKMKQVTLGGGYENSKIFLIEQEDFELVKSAEYH